jgi:hypothetical protein
VLLIECRGFPEVPLIGEIGRLQERRAGIDYFAASIYPPIPTGNQTVSNRYVLYFDQVNGGAVVGVFVNSSVTQVVGVYRGYDCRLFGVNGNICST